MTAVRERLEFQAGGTRALIRENGRAGRPLNDGHVAGSSKVLPPLAPYVCWFAVSLDAVKGEIAVMTFEREGEVRQRGGCGKLRAALHRETRVHRERVHKTRRM